MNLSIERIFTETGGTFSSPPTELQNKLSSIKAFVFDWDGVFNDGSKSVQQGSTFSEPNSMGINLLRFSYWLARGFIPATAILSGEQNATGSFFAKRENFDAVYFKSSDKRIALNHFLAAHHLQVNEVCFMFDDVLDLSLAEICGVRILVRSNASPLFKQFVSQSQLADYITANSGGNHAVREACELVMGLNDMYEKAVEHRIRFSKEYQKYLKLRNKTATKIFQLEKGVIEEVK